MSANLGARLLALRKPNGTIRPIACGSVLRRLAARALCAASRDDIKELESHGFSHSAISDAAQVISFFNYINRIAEGLGVDLEESMQAKD